MFTTHTHSYTSTLVDGIDVVLAHSPLDFLNRFSEKVGNKIVVGYIVDDSDAENPLENMDGEGSIYTAHRHGSTLRKFFEAIGRDRNGDLDYDSLLEHPEAFKALWTDVAANESEFRGWLLEQTTFVDAGDKPEAVYKREAEKLWDRTGGCNAIAAAIYDFGFTSKVEDQLYRKLVADGKIGDPDAVLLDVYEHSGVVYSVSGTGMQCQFDTSNGGAVWVPEEFAREEVTRRAVVYRHGMIQSSTLGSHKVWTFQLDGEEKATGTFSSWGECFEAASKRVEGIDGGDERLGRRRAAAELAQSACKLYTDYCNGSVYGVVVETHRVSEGSDESEVVDVESVYGFYGIEAAEEELKTQFESEVAEQKSILQAETKH